MADPRGLGPDVPVLRAITRINEGIDADPRRQLWTHLDAKLTELKTKNHSIILMRDFNASLYNDPDCLFRSLVKRHNLVDPLQFINEEKVTCPTHRRRSKRINYILCTAEVVKAICHFGILAYDEVIISDHRATFCDIDFSIL